MIVRLYRGLTALGAPLINVYLRLRLNAGKEDAQRFGERSGIASRERPSGGVVWMHGASVGESLSLLPLAELIGARPNTTVLITTGTVASARMLEDRLPPGVIHQYVPVDRMIWVRRFLDHWRPDLALWCESEFWPNLLLETASRGVPMILVNGRISDRSFARWKSYPRFIGKILASFVLCLGQSTLDAERLRALGANNVHCLGNLKFAAPPLPASAPDLAALALPIGDRPCWLAASTHAGEETAIGRIHLTLAAQFPGLLTIVAPRHPTRADEIGRDLDHMGLAVARRSAHDPIGPGTNILLVDTMGELGLFMRLAPIVFMGKSLLAKGGQNPLEPARLGASVLFGPHMDNFTELASRLEQQGGAERVADEEGLAAAVARRLSDPEFTSKSGQRARAFAEYEAGILDALLAEMKPWLPATEAGP
jgi:3-deoxy-D-manno-octulosonic-acid transferase